MHKSKYILGNISRGTDDHWESVEPECIAQWKLAAELLSKREYRHGEARVTVSAEISKLADRYAQLHDTRKSNMQSEGQGAASDWELFWQPLEIDVDIAIEGEHEYVNYDWFPHSFSALYAYDLFLAMNLSLPGSCDFHNLVVIGPGGTIPTELRLSGSLFEFALTDHLNGKWPPARKIPLRQVIEWLIRLNIGTKQMADTPVERALFAALHLCSKDDQVDTVIWTFYTLEALFETRVGESMSGLVRRISLLLDFSESDKKKLNKLLRQLYDFRSSIVHGGYSATHPMHLETLDPRVSDSYMSRMDLIDFGFKIVLLCIQELIHRGWCALSFNEAISGARS